MQIPNVCAMKIEVTSKAIWANHIFVSVFEAKLCVAVAFHSACAYIILAMSSDFFILHANKKIHSI